MISSAQAVLSALMPVCSGRAGRDTDECYMPTQGAMHTRQLVGVGAFPSSANVRDRAARVSAPAVGELSALLLMSVSVMLRALAPRPPLSPSPEPSAARRSRRGTGREPPPKAIGCDANSFDGVAGRSAARKAVSTVSSTVRPLQPTTGYQRTSCQLQVVHPAKVAPGHILASAIWK